VWGFSRHALDLSRHLGHPPGGTKPEDDSEA
jgi:hypothetical protein